MSIYAAAAMTKQQNEIIEGIVSGMSKTARTHLISMLGELFTTMANLDAICPTPCPPCHAYMKFERLNQLLASLLENNARGETAP